MINQDWVNTNTEPLRVGEAPIVQKIDRKGEMVISFSHEELDTLTEIIKKDIESTKNIDLIYKKMGILKKVSL